MTLENFQFTYSPNEYQNETSSFQFIYSQNEYQNDTWDYMAKAQ